MEPKNELQRNAITTTRRKELESYQRALDRQWLDSRMADGGMSRCLALIKREAEMEKDFRERTDHAAIVNKRAAEETSLGREVAQIEREEINLLQRRHFLRERDPELRELTRKLEAGYVCRDLKQQIVQNEHRRIQEKADEHRAVDQLRHSLANDKEHEEALERDKLQASAQHGAALQQQLVSRQRERHCRFEDELVEKKMLDQIMRTISDEDQRELKQKREQTEIMRHEMETSQRARAAWRLQRQASVVLEEEQIERQARAAADRSSGIIAEREWKLREKEALNEIVCSKILAEQAAKQERADIITLIQEQEYLEKNSNDDLALREKLERVKRETKDALTSQMMGKIKLGEEEKARDAALREENEIKFRADDEIERQKALSVRQKNQKYSEDLKQQIQGNALRRKQGKEEEERRSRRESDTVAGWMKEVSAERAQIVAQHAPPVLGHLQAGALRWDDLAAVRPLPADTLQVLGPQGARELDKLDAGAVRRPKRFAKCNPQCTVIRKY